MYRGGIVLGATGAAAVAFVVAWFLPWMADTAAFPLIGHGLTSRGFLFDTPPGPGASLEMALFGLLGVAAIVAGLLVAPIASAVIAVLTGLLGIHLVLRDHPGLSSGPGALVATVAMFLLAAAQIAVVWQPARGSVIVGAAVAALLAVAAVFGGSAYATARDTDVTESKALTAVTVGEQRGPLSGITAADAKTGAERWHDWQRAWSGAEVGLSPDGHTAYLMVDTTTGREALAFVAATGELLWQKQLEHLDWQPSGGVDYPYLSQGFMPGPGLLVVGGLNGEVRYLDVNGQEGTIRLDANCGKVIGVGGVQRLYLVEQCGGAVNVLAVDRNANRLWSTTAFPPAIDADRATVDDRGDRLVLTVNGLTATLNAGTGRP